MKKLFLAASGGFAAIPGLAVILRGIGAPPGYEYLFGGVIEAFGSLSLIILWINRNKLRRLARSRITKAAIKLTVFGFGCLAIYLWLFNWCVVTDPTHGTIYYPLWLSGHVAEVVNAAGGRWRALADYGNYALYKEIRQMPVYALIITTVVLLFVYQTIFTSWTIAFGLLGLYEEESVI